VIDAFAQRNGLVKDTFVADAAPDSPATKPSPSVRPPSVPAAAPIATESWSTLPKEPSPAVEPAPSVEDDALLRELDGVGRDSDSDADWLENPAVPRTDERASEVEVDMDGEPIPVAVAEPTGAIAKLLDGDDGTPSDDGAAPRRPGALPGLPSSLSRPRKSVPPPLPDSTPPKRK